MVNVWGSKYSSRNQAVRDAEDDTLEIELMDRNWQFLPQNEYFKLKSIVESHKYGKITDNKMLDEVYRLVGWIMVN